MTRDQLISEIKKKKSFLCVGLDPDLNKIPQHLLKEKDPIFSFNKAIIDATKEHVVAYKPNLAFYECHGAKGWDSFKKTVDYIGENIMCIADAKEVILAIRLLFTLKHFLKPIIAMPLRWHHIWVRIVSVLFLILRINGSLYLH